MPPRKANLKSLLLGKAAFLIVAFGFLVILGQWIGINVWKPSGVTGVGLFAISAVAGILADRMVQRILSDP